jgi:tRNA threonylcarbamoyladenosine biosynthesis protein TsaE
MDLNFSLDDIQQAAIKVVSLTKDRKVVALHAAMGAGKTTFVHAICEVLGVKDVVGSPTFSIINQYESKSGETIYHIDLYRLKDEEEVIQCGVEDCLYSGNLCFVEWPDKAASLLPANTLNLHIVPVNNVTRKLTINL